jgi:hypothetical protein
MEKLNIESISHRIQSETPAFWKKVRKVGMAIGAVGLAVQAAVSAKTLILPSYINPEWIHSMILIGVIVTALSSMTTTDKPKD